MSFRCQSLENLALKLEHLDSLPQVGLNVDGYEAAIAEGTAVLTLPPGSARDEATATIAVPRGRAAALRTRGPRDAPPPRTGGRAATLGRRTVMIVRIVARDGATTLSEERLSDALFGNGLDGAPDAATLRSQYDACSHGRFGFDEPPDREGNGIRLRRGERVAGSSRSRRRSGGRDGLFSAPDFSHLVPPSAAIVASLRPGLGDPGAVTVTVDESVAVGDRVIGNLVMEALADEFGVGHPRELADHAVFCMPEAAMSSIAYAVINGFCSVYRDSW